MVLENGMIDLWWLNGWWWHSFALCLIATRRARAICHFSPGPFIYPCCLFFYQLPQKNHRLPHFEAFLKNILILSVFFGFVSSGRRIINDERVSWLFYTTDR